MQTFPRMGMALFWLGLHTLGALAGGGPQNVLIVVNDRSPESLELGTYYAQARGIPSRQICHVSVHTNYDLDWFGFTNGLRDPIIRHLGAQGISNQIDYIVFSRDIPYRIYTNAYADNRHAGLTGTMFYGLKTSPDAFTIGCDLAPGSDNPYYFAERAFRHGDSTGSNRLYIATLLSGWTLDEALRLVDGSTSADGTAPPASFNFVHTSDDARSVQWPNFDAAEFLARSADGPVDFRLLDAETLGGASNVLSYMTGSAGVADIASNGYIRGAFSEHFTSFGGKLLEPSGQMSALEWIRFGHSGAYGTVVEPCNYTNKFTEPVFGYWYTRGFNLAESQYMSVRNPYQGVLAGDPLCAPYATGLPQVALGGLTNQQIVSGTFALVVTASTTQANARIARLDLFLDGLWMATLTNIPPTPGNVARVTVGASTASYTVAAADDVHAVARGLAQSVNFAGMYSATSHGDRVQVQHKSFGVTATNIALAFEVSPGTASETMLDGRAVAPHLLDTISPAREYLALEGVANTGDVVVLTVTLTNGTVTTNTIVAAQDEQAADVLQRVMNAVNMDPQLLGTNGISAKYLNTSFGSTYTECELEARMPGPGGYSNFVDYLVLPASPGSGLSNSMSFTSRMDDNRNVLRGRGTVLLSSGRTNLVVAQTLDTTSWTDGPHRLEVVAYDGAGPALQGRVRVVFSVSNHPAACAIQASQRNITWGNAVTVTVSGTSGIGTVTQLVLLAEGKTNAVAAANEYSFPVATTNYGAGPLELQARADVSAGFACLSAPVALFLHTDRDGDGLSDQWEYSTLGSTSNALPAADPDADGMPNSAEFIADTNPTNGTDFLRFNRSMMNGISVILEQPARTTRVYRLEMAGTPDGPWAGATNAAIQPQGTSVVWSVTASNAPVFMRSTATLP